MKLQMVIELDRKESGIVKRQCRYCSLWHKTLGCQYYPLTANFEDNRPVADCHQFKRDLREIPEGDA